MRSRLVKVVLAFGIASVTTVHAIVPTNIPCFKPFLGLSYSPFQGNESPNFNSFPSVADIAYDLTNSVTYLASEIETYGMDGTLSNIPALCNSFNIMCYPCAYLSTNGATDNPYEINALIAVGNQNFPTTRGLIVGTESILFGYSPATLISNINYVRAATGNSVPVGTRDAAASFANNPAVVAACDFIQVDTYAYWAKMPVDEAAVWTIQQWQALTNQFPGTRVEIGETDWPCGGTNALWDDGAVVPSVANQDKFLSEFIPLANSNGIEYFIFDFRDETWKVQDGYGTIETNWGVLYATNVKKQSLLDHLSDGFSLNMTAASQNTATIWVDTYESDPYLLFSTTNLTVPGNLAVSFTGAAGTNQTAITVTNSSGQGAWFYNASQNF